MAERHYNSYTQRYALSNMNSKFNLIIFIFSILFSCGELNNEKSTILLNSEYNKRLKSEYGYFVWNPKKSDLEIVNKVLKKAIADKKFDFIKKPILENINNNLFKQYIPYIDKNNNRIILLNVSCDVLAIPTLEDQKMEHWKNEFYEVYDGGSCYWKITINVDTEKYSNLLVNGV